MTKVFHTPTLEEFKKIVKQALDDGYKWREEDSKEINKYLWKKYEEDTVVYLYDEDEIITFGSKQFVEGCYSNDPNYLLTWLKPFNTINITGLKPETVEIIKQAIEKDKQEDVGKQIIELLENEKIVIIKDKDDDYRIITPLKDEDGKYISSFYEKSIEKCIPGLGKNYLSKSEIEESSKELNWKIHSTPTFEELFKLNK